jgi:hypothetical protein
MERHKEVPSYSRRLITFLKVNHRKVINNYPSSNEAAAPLSTTYALSPIKCRPRTSTPIPSAAAVVTVAWILASLGRLDNRRHAAGPLKQPFLF